MGVSIEKIHPSLGVEVKGVDLSKPVDPETAAAIRKAFDENIVLVVRNQNLDEQQQLKAAEMFGKVAYRRRPIVGDGP
ncbi:MAG: TauD/TfdA dioxygenase family protein, partial [Beijerinckiaceae bacterium]